MLATATVDSGILWHTRIIEWLCEQWFLWFFYLSSVPNWSLTLRFFLVRHQWILHLPAMLIILFRCKINNGNILSINFFMHSMYRSVICIVFSLSPVIDINIYISGHRRISFVSMIIFGVHIFNYLTRCIALASAVCISSIISIRRCPVTLEEVQIRALAGVFGCRVSWWTAEVIHFLLFHIFVHIVLLYSSCINFVHWLIHVHIFMDPGYIFHVAIFCQFFSIITSRSRLFIEIFGCFILI